MNLPQKLEHLEKNLAQVRTASELHRDEKSQRSFLQYETSLRTLHSLIVHVVHLHGHMLEAILDESFCEIDKAKDFVRKHMIAAIDGRRDTNFLWYRSNAESNQQVFSLPLDRVKEFRVASIA